MSLSKPALLNSNHDFGSFDCGEATLNEWLKNKSLKNQNSGASRTFVTCRDNKVVGFYALAAGSVAHNETIGRFKRNMPNPIPVTVLARLAIDLSTQGTGLGRALVKDAIQRTINISNQVAVRGIIVKALSDSARLFYEHIGFNPSPLDDYLLMATLAELKLATLNTEQI